MISLGKNMIYSIMYKFVLVVTGLIIQRYVLSSFGSDINGLYSSITQFLSYMILLESGVGTASIQALYRPLANNDWPSANAVIAATKQQYAKICRWFLLLLVGLSFLIPCIVSSQVEMWTAGLLTFVSGLSSVVTYAFLGKYVILLTADNRIGVTYIIDSFLNILSCLLRLFAIYVEQSIIVVQSILVVMAILKSIIIFIYVNKNYRNLDLKVKPDNKAISQRWSVMVHQIAGLVVNHTDVTVLTIFSTLKNVSVYSVYNYIYSNISTILNTTFSQAIQASFGRLATGDKETYNKAFKLFESIYYGILFSILSTALIMTLPFVSLYTKGVTDINYIIPSIALLFCGCQIINLIRVPSIITINAYGWFQETKKGAIIEAIINITVSLALYPFWGLKGLLIGTICSYLYRTQDVIIFVYKKCMIGWKNLFVNLLINIGCFLILIFIFFVWKPITVTGWTDWIIKAICIFVLTIGVFYIVNYIPKYKEYNNLLKRMILRR